MTDTTHTGHLDPCSLRGQLIDRWGWVILLTATPMTVNGRQVLVLEGRTGPIPEHMRIPILDDSPDAA